MKIIALSPLLVRRPTGEKFYLAPGVPVELPDDDARRLLEKVPGKVKCLTDSGEFPRPGNHGGEPAGDTGPARGGPTPGAMANGATGVTPTWGVPAPTGEGASGSNRGSNGTPGEGVTIEPAYRPDGRPLSPVYWERADGSIVGPATPELFARIGSGNEDRNYWLLVDYQDASIWIRSDRLRSRRDFERHRPVRTIEPIQAGPLTAPAEPGAPDRGESGGGGSLGREPGARRGRLR